MVELNEIICCTLEKMNIDKELIESKILEQLNKIEIAITQAFRIQEEHKNAIKETKPSVNKLASQTGIARQTFYNNPLLKAYAEYRIAEYHNSDVNKKNDKLMERITHLENKVKLMSERDVGIELLRRKVSMLESNIKTLKQENKELHEKYNNSIKEKNSKKNTTQDNTSNITVLPIK